MVLFQKSDTLQRSKVDRDFLRTLYDGNLCSEVPSNHTDFNAEFDCL